MFNRTILILFILLAGCSTRPGYKTISVYPQSCEYFVAEISFELSDRSLLNVTSPFQEENVDLQVIHEKILLNSAADAWRDAQMSGYVGGGFTGFEAANLAGSQGGPTPKCSRDEMKAGWFDPADLTNNYSPLIVDLSVEVSGEIYEVYTAYSPDRELRYKFREPIFEQHVKAARRKAYSLLSEQIKNN